MRDGRCVLHRPMAGLSRHDLIEAMLGRGWRCSSRRRPAARRPGARGQRAPTPGVVKRRRRSTLVPARSSASPASRVRDDLGCCAPSPGSSRQGGVGHRRRCRSPLGAAAMAGVRAGAEDRKRFGLVLERAPPTPSRCRCCRYSSKACSGGGGSPGWWRRLVAQLGIKVVVTPGERAGHRPAATSKGVLGRCLATEPRCCSSTSAAVSTSGPRRDPRDRQVRRRGGT